jgi:hypothetical protein
MMEENQFWFRICALAAVVVLALIASCTQGMHDKREKWEKAVANGADPMVASCALFTQERVEEAACLLIAQNRK